MNRPIVGLVAIGGFLLAGWGLDGALNAYRARLVPKNFSVVTPNLLYRSGQLRPEHFEAVIKKYRIRTVICLNPGESAEEAWSARLGVEYHALAMPGCGRGRPKQFARILELIGTPQRQPVLIHCAAGAYRTGVAVALYRMCHQGWRLADAASELAYSGCPIGRDRALRGYLGRVWRAVSAGPTLTADLSASR